MVDHHYLRLLGLSPGQAQEAFVEQRAVVVLAVQHVGTDLAPQSGGPGRVEPAMLGDVPGFGLLRPGQKDQGLLPLFGVQEKV